MAKGKYRYNPETLSYEKIRLSLKQKIGYYLTYLIAITVMGVIFSLLYFSVFEPPQVKILNNKLKNYERQFKQLNKKFDQVSNVLEDLQERDNNIYRQIFEAEPIPDSKRKAGFGGINRYEELENMGNMELVIETSKQLDKLTKQITVQSKSFDEIIDLAKNKEEMLRCIPAIQPLSNNSLIRLASGFGYRIHPIYKTRKMHQGLDLTARTGTKIYATGDGIVASAQFGRGYGKMVKIDHGYNYETVYAHMSKILVKKGQEVKRGDVIGLVGNTGTSTGPHLHYEVRKARRPVNPINYYLNDLTPEQYDEMIEVAARPAQSFD